MHGIFIENVFAPHLVEVTAVNKDSIPIQYGKVMMIMMTKRGYRLFKKIATVMG